MSNKRFMPGQPVTFKYGARSIQGVVKEDRGPIGMKGRVLYLIEFRPEVQSPYAYIELPADQLREVASTICVN
jgi:hypothetical protein